MANPPIFVHQIPQPVQIPTVRPFLEKIIDKKVNVVALNIFEWLADKFCSYFYTAYQNRLAFRLEQMEKKVHHFADGIPLFDLTSTQRVAITHSQFVKEMEQIAVDGKVIHFGRDRFDYLFGKDYGTQSLTVADVKDFPEIVIIYERATNHQIKAWCIDITQPTKQETVLGQVPIGEEEIFIAQQIIPQAAPPQTIQVPFI